MAVTLHDKRDLAGVVMLYIFRWDSYPGVSGWTFNVNISVLIKWEAQGDLTTDQRGDEMVMRQSVQNWSRVAAEKKCPQAPEVERGRETDSLPEGESHAHTLTEPR